MNARKRSLAIAGAFLLALSCVNCGSKLPRALRNEIASEKESLQQAERQLQAIPDDFIAVRIVADR